MAERIKPREWETLSAYLDGELAAGKRERLQGRLDNSPDLREALEEMRRTRALLRSQPTLRAPRNFTLSPKMAGFPGKRRVMPQAYPMLRFAAVIMSVFLALVLAGDLFTSALQPAQLAMDAAPQMAMVPEMESDAAEALESFAEPAAEAGNWLEEAAPPPLPGEQERAPLEKQGAARSEEDVPVGKAGGEPPPEATMAVMEISPEEIPRDNRPPHSGLSILRITEIALFFLVMIFAAGAYYTRRSAGE